MIQSWSRNYFFPEKCPKETFILLIILLFISWSIIINKKTYFKKFKLFYFLNSIKYVKKKKVSWYNLKWFILYFNGHIQTCMWYRSSRFILNRKSFVQFSILIINECILSLIPLFSFHVVIHFNRWPDWMSFVWIWMRSTPPSPLKWAPLCLAYP